MFLWLSLRFDYFVLGFQLKQDQIRYILVAYHLYRLVAYHLYRLVAYHMLSHLCRLRI